MSDEREEHYRRILRQCHPLITQHCNPDELVEQLSAQHLLTSNEAYILNNRLLPPLQRLNELVEWLPRKGGNWFERFANALAAIPNPGGHVTVLKKMREMAEEANYPLPSHLLSSPATFGNHGDSLFDVCSDYSVDSPGDSLSITTVTTVDPVEEQNRPIQEQQCYPDHNSRPSMIILDKISSLLVKALGSNWGRIHSYCYHEDEQFNVAISNIKREFQDHPHMQILMTLKQWTRAKDCSCHLLYDRIKPLLDHSPNNQLQLRTLIFNGYRHDASHAMGTVTQPDDALGRAEIDKIAKNMLVQISSTELYRVALYCGISDDTMETFKSQHRYSPITLLSSILLHWVSNHYSTTRRDLAVVLDNLGVSPSSVM